LKEYNDIGKFGKFDEDNFLMTIREYNDLKKIGDNKDEEEKGFGKERNNEKVEIS